MRFLPPIRQLVGAAVALYVAIKLGHSEALAAWGHYGRVVHHATHRSSGSHSVGRAVQRTYRRSSGSRNIFSRHTSSRPRSSGHVRSSVRHVAAHPGRASRSGGRLSPARTPGLRGLSARQAAFLSVLGLASAKHGYSRKSARALFTAIATHGSGYNWILNAANSADPKHRQRAIAKAGTFLARASQLEHKYGDSALLAAAVGGRAPAQRYKKNAPIAKQRLHDSLVGIKVPGAYRYTGGSYAGQKALFARIGKKHNIDPRVLWAIYHIESNYGRLNTNNPHDGGVLGPMQFQAGTWAAYGKGKDVHKLAPSVDAAARYLKAAGASGSASKNPAGYQKGVFAYNHAGWYVNRVLGDLGAFGTGRGGGKKVRVKRKGGPYAQLRSAYAKPKRSRLPGAPSGSSGAPRSSGTPRSPVGVRGASAAPASSPAQIAASATQLASSILAQQQTPQIQPTLPAAPAAINAQSYLPLPSAFVDQGTGLSAPSLGAVHVRGLGLGRRSLSSYLRGR